MNRLTLGVSVRTKSRPCGTVVSQVDPGSPLEEGSRVSGYIVVELNDQPVRSKADFDQAARSLKSGQQDVSLIFVNAAKRPVVRDLKRFDIASTVNTHFRGQKQEPIRRGSGVKRLRGVKPCFLFPFRSGESGSSSKTEKKA